MNIKEQLTKLPLEHIAFKSFVRQWPSQDTNNIMLFVITTDCYLLCSFMSNTKGDFKPFIGQWVSIGAIKETVGEFTLRMTTTADFVEI